MCLETSMSYYADAETTEPEACFSLLKRMYTYIPADMYLLQFRLRAVLTVKSWPFKSLKCL